MAHKNPKWISKKISIVMHEGVKGKKVKRNQATAIAYSMAKAKHKKK